MSKKPNPVEQDCLWSNWGPKQKFVTSFQTNKDADVLLLLVYGVAQSNAVHKICLVDDFILRLSVHGS